MTTKQWNIFLSWRDTFRSQIVCWQKFAPLLLPLQQAAAQADNNPEYPLETPIVYNHSLDDITKEDDIRLIVIGDNPGKDEQLKKNQRYLVGQAGKLADGFFRRNAELGIDFRKNVIILNKTPIHTAKTKQLTYVLKHAPREIIDLFIETQIWMATHTAQLQQELNCSIWLVGYGELREKGLFTAYRDTLTLSMRGHISAYTAQSYTELSKNPLLVFQHFSMNRFSIDLQSYIWQCLSETGTPVPLSQSITELGLLHRREIMGF